MIMIIIPSTIFSLPLAYLIVSASKVSQLSPAAQIHGGWVSDAKAEQGVVAVTFLLLFVNPQDNQVDILFQVAHFEEYGWS